ncbi:ABC transporter permease [Leucobacter insecticola]|uniref:ABC transporter permease n=1 Tax=Leucobacter insecticola TaxID=2714934 RepID=A0A6G8FKJ0_9MICO|nr:ABC transporter permease [Leucobacter insecticola]QIM16871.1 ABC transporter permease [Leucobacter insecticola]
MRALIVKEFRELARDRRTLAMLVVLPVLLLVIFGYAANFSVDRVTVIILGSEAEALAADIQDFDIAVDELEILRVDPTLGESDVENLLGTQEANAVILAETADDGPLIQRMRVFLDGSGLFTAQAASGVFAKLAAEDAQTRVAALQASASGVPPLLSAPQLNLAETDTSDMITVLFNPDLKTSWVMVPGLIGLILLFIGALITSIGLVREREAGTLEQLAVMPLRPSAIILGKITPYFLLALVNMAAVTALGVWLFGVPFTGSLVLFAAAAIVFLFVVLGIGVLISSVSQNTGQAIQLAILFVVPQILLSGLIFPLDSMPLGVRWIGFVLPLTWFREITQGVMLRDAGLDSLWLPLTVLAVMAVVAFGAATARMRHSLTHGGAR